MPTKNPAVDRVPTDSRVSPIPASSAPLPVSMSCRALRRWSSSTAAAPLPASKDRDKPPSTTEPEPETSLTSAGPSAPYSPAMAHTATRAGTANSSGRRTGPGTAK